jgi:pyroglutamyl-peptidase
MSVLVTGFGPYDGGSNASQALVEAIAERRDEAERSAGEAVHTRILDVDTRLTPALLLDLVEELQPSRVLLCGQAIGRERVALERRAFNFLDFIVPDCMGQRPRGACVLDGGPAFLDATWPDLDGTASALNAAGIPAYMSGHAGAHLCNQVFYTLLHALGPAATCAVTFLHVPALPDQVARAEPATERVKNCPSMPLGLTQRTVHMLLARSAPARG